MKSVRDDDRKQMDLPLLSAMPGRSCKNVLPPPSKAGILRSVEQMSPDAPSDPDELAKQLERYLQSISW